MAKEKEDRAQKRIDEEHAMHKGEWLTKEICLKYKEEAQSINEFDSQDVRKHKELRMELQERYGLTQIEAINILNGNNIADYVNKYNRVMMRQPLINLK